MFFVLHELTRYLGLETKHIQLSNNILDDLPLEEGGFDFPNLLGHLNIGSSPNTFHICR